MAYPTVSAPFGLKPINLIGGQVFSGSTRYLPIQYGYNINIFYGDVVSITKGYVTRLALTDGGSAAAGAPNYGQVGVFLGCTYTSPTTKQKQFAQYWPAGTLAGDCQAIICDDPDTLFKVAVVTAQGGTTIGSVNNFQVGTNLIASNLAGSTNTGNSSNGVVSTTALLTATTLPFRLVSVVPDTAITSSVVSTSAVTSTTIACTGGLSVALPVGTEVGYLAPNGQYVGTGSFVSSAAAAGATSVTINAQPTTVNAGGATPSNVASIASGSTFVFTQYPEAIVKFNFGIHEYYNATGSTLG
jgi:hypothetical protein